MTRDKACSCRRIFWRVRRVAKEDQTAVVPWGGTHSQTVWIYARGPQKSKRVMVPSANHTCRPCNHTTVISIHRIHVRRTDRSVSSRLLRDDCAHLRSLSVLRASFKLLFNISVDHFVFEYVIQISTARRILSGSLIRIVCLHPHRFVPSKVFFKTSLATVISPIMHLRFSTSFA